MNTFLTDAEENVPIFNRKVSSFYPASRENERESSRSHVGREIIGHTLSNNSAPSFLSPGRQQNVDDGRLSFMCE